MMKSAGRHSARTQGTLVLSVVAFFTVGMAGCDTQEDNRAGTLTSDDMPASVEIVDVRHDDQAGQVYCQAVNDAEDGSLLVASDPYGEAESDAVELTLAGDRHESVASLSMRVSDPEAAVAAVAEGARACAEEWPQHYRILESVSGQPDAVGYTARENDPPVFTRRILVPLDRRVVVVSVSRSGDDHFSVSPDSLLDTAVSKADQAD